MATYNVIDEITAAQVRQDVSDAMSVVMTKDLFLRHIPWGSERFSGDSTGEFKWMEERRVPYMSQIRENYIAGVLVFKLTDGFQRIAVGDRFHLDGHIDLNGDEIVYECTVVGTNVKPNDLITCVVVYGVDTAYTLGTTGDNSVRLTRSEADGSLATLGGTDEPGARINYFQLFGEGVYNGQKAIELSQSGLQNGFSNALGDSLRRGVEQAMYRMGSRIHEAVVRGIATGEAGGIGSYMGGINQAMATAPKIDAGAAVISLDLINDAIEGMFNAGLPAGSEVLLVCDAKNTRAVSALLNTLASYTNPGQNATLGTNVQTIYAEIHGMRVTIVPNNFGNVKTINVLSKDWINLVAKNSSGPGDREPNTLDMGASSAPPGVAWLVNATTPGQHGVSLALRSELSMQLRQPETYHAQIIDLIA